MIVISLVDSTCIKVVKFLIRILLSTEITSVQLKNKRAPITLRQALESYNERVEFVERSSSACVVSSGELL